MHRDDVSVRRPTRPGASAAGRRWLTLTAEQESWLRAAESGDAAAADAFNASVDAHPVTLCAEILSTKRVPAGSGVSYGHTYVTATETVLARAAIGYGHGLPRKAGNRACVTWSRPGADTAQLPIVGRVAMDEFVIDVDSVPVEPGSVVVVFGDVSRGEVPLRAWADAIGETPVSVVAGFDARVERRIP